MKYLFNGDYEFDLQEARYNDNCTYGNAYSASNEPLNYIMKLVPITHRRILSVAASGDQPILYAANGAAIVDTFDITCVARVIMDFKVGAIQALDRKHYLEQILDIHNLNLQQPSTYFKNAVGKMPKDTRAIINMFKHHRIDAFHKYDSGDWEELFEICTNWPEMKQKIHKPFNFIWTDLTNLHKHINGKYDIINVSNIFEYYKNRSNKKDKILTTLQNLWPHLNINGHIVCTAFGPIDNIITLKVREFLNYRAEITHFDALNASAIHCGIIIIQKQR